jgi:hypothetical protein
VCFVVLGQMGARSVAAASAEEEALENEKAALIRKSILAEAMDLLIARGQLDLARFRALVGLLDRE